MALDLTGAQSAITALFQTRTLRTVGRSPNVTSACGFSTNTPSSGGIARADGRDQGEGRYVITLPATTTLELTVGELVTVDEIAGRRFRVTWAPPASNLNLSRRVLADEVR
jgi:hypothetical protein